MQSKREIKNILDSFLEGKADNDDKRALFNFFNDPENKTYVYKWLKKNWKEVNPVESAIDFPEDQLLERIHNEIKVRRLPDRPFRKRVSPRIKKIAVTTLRYAAVCLIACGIEWYFLSNPVSKPKIVQTRYNEINVPYGSKSYIVLADSTKIWLNAGAKLRYPTAFEGKDREIYLAGEAFFDVRKDKHRPFFVKMDGIDLKVLGTKFNVKAYDDDPKIEATLLEGSIEVIGLKSDKNNLKGNLLMKPGQKLILYKDRQRHHQISTDARQNMDSVETMPINKTPVKIMDTRLLDQVAIEPVIAWKKDKLVFNKQRFDEVKVLLERWYGVTIDVQDSSVLNYRFTGTFDKETFEQAMKALQEAAGFEYELNKKHVVIKKAV